MDEIKIELTSRPIVAMPRKLKAQWTLEGFLQPMAQDTMDIIKALLEEVIENTHVKKVIVGNGKDQHFHLDFNGSKVAVEIENYDLLFRGSRFNLYEPDLSEKLKKAIIDAGPNPEPDEGRTFFAMHSVGAEASLTKMMADELMKDIDRIIVKESVNKCRSKVSEKPPKRT